MSKSAIPRRIPGLEPRKGGDSNGAGHSPWRYLLPPCRFLVKMVPYSKLSVYLCEGISVPEADSSVRTAETRGFQRSRAPPVAMTPSTSRFLVNMLPYSKLSVYLLQGWSDH